MNLLPDLFAASQPDRPSITDLGRRPWVITQDALAEAHLWQIPAYREHVPATRTTLLGSVEVAPADTVLDPLEPIDAGVQRLRARVVVGCRCGVRWYGGGRLWEGSRGRLSQGP